MSSRVGKAARQSRVKKKKAGKRKKKARPAQAQQYATDHLLEKVEACLDSFQYEKAARLCVHAVEQEPDSVRVLEEVGPVLLELGHADIALKCMMRAAELRPDEGYVKFLYLGQLHSGEEAVGYLTTAISIMRREREEHVDVECVSGAGVNGAGVNGAGVSGEDISRAYCSLADIYLTDLCFSSEAGERCYDSCQQAVKFGPGNAEAHQLLASCLLSMGRSEEAKDAIQRSLLLWLPAIVGTGGEGWRKETESEGGASVRGDCVGGEGVALPPYFARVSCAKILMELQLHDEAHSVLERLLRDDDEVVLVWYLMGWLHTMTGDADSAHFYLEQAGKLAGKTDCDDEEMVAHIAELLEDVGHMQRQLTDKGEGEREEEEREGVEREGEGDGEGESSWQHEDIMDTT